MNLANAPHTDAPASRPVALADGQGQELLSALVDGELAITEVDDALLVDSANEQAASRRYLLIGQCLRGEPLQTPVVSAQAFLAAVRTRLADEPQPAVTPWVQVPAANDPLFRWKMVAGFASLAAVMAVSWNLLGSVPGTPPGPQMAVLSPAGQTVVGGSSPPAALPAAPAAMVVNTAQGPVLRDPRLEQLLAEHRHYGGMSALQMPAGFLRDATHSVDVQR